MRKPFTTQPELFISSAELNHPMLHALDDTEAVLDWSKIELMLAPIYASQTGRPSYPLLTLFTARFAQVFGFDALFVHNTAPCQCQARHQISEVG